MRLLKGIGLFLIYPCVMLGIGFLSGMYCSDYFYPGNSAKAAEAEEEPDVDWKNMVQGNMSDSQEPAENKEGQAQAKMSLTDEAESSLSPENVVDVSAISDKLTADTIYILEETDIRNQTVVETTWKVPAKYLGMNRDQFLEAMDEYEATPPLAELERGFVSLEVLSFSVEKVVVQMNYEYTQPSSSFYLMVENNYVVVYLDDRKTIYMYTDILLSGLPDDVQQDIINVMFMEDEETLYNFLETYSS